VVSGPGPDGAPRFIGFTSLRGDAEPGVVLTVSILQKTVFAEADQILNRNLFWLGIVALIALAAAWFGSDLFILRPLNRLLNASRRLRNGDLNARTGLSRGTGEVARLAHTFDDMAGALQRRHIEAAQAAEALRQSEERFRLLVERVKDYAIFALDPEGRIVSWNEGAERIKGYRAEEILGQHMSRFYTPEDIERRHPAHLLEAAETEGRVEDEGWRVRKDGSRLWANGTITALRDDGGNLRGFVKVMRDLTERRQAELAISELSGRLLQVQDEERRRMARELHDSTSPLLTALIARLYNARYRTGDLDATTARVIDEGLKLAEDTSNVIRTVSSLLHPPLLEDSGLLATLRWHLTGFANRTGIQVVMDLPEELRRLPRDAEIALFRIAQECLMNILAHSGSPLAKVRLGVDQGSLKLEVADEGRGIPSGVLKRITTGTGELGVGIVGMRERMRQLGGRLEVSASSSGTVVTAILPLSERLSPGGTGAGTG
jgi:PAS domain S-box-containing protein